MLLKCNKVPIVCIYVLKVRNKWKKEKKQGRIIIFVGKRRRIVGNNKPLELGLELLNKSNIVGEGAHRFITSDFGIINSMAKLKAAIFRIGQPYRIKEGRIAQPLQGEVRFAINLTEYTLRRGDILLISPGAIIEVLYISPDFDIRMVAPSNDFIHFSHKDGFFSHYLSGQLNYLLTVTDEEWNKIDSFFTLMWDVLQEPTYQREVVRSLLTGLYYYMEYVQGKTQTAVKSLSRQEELFQRFIALVNAHCITQKNVSFYADKLCLTPRYLNTIIKQVSQQTVMEWINQAVILEAKVLLKHSDLLVYQISDQLNFPNPSFFCKFFKKMTHLTPQQYQRR